MYVSDWSDNGECHDHDGVHRTSGRIYRIAYGTPAKPKLPVEDDLSLLDHMTKTDWDLVGMLAACCRKCSWMDRRRILQSMKKMKPSPFNRCFLAALDISNDTKRVTKALESQDAIVLVQAIDGLVHS